MRNWKGHCALHMSYTLEHNFMISILSWTDPLQAERVNLRYSFSLVPRRTMVSPWTYIYWNLRKDLNFREMLTYQSVLYYSKIIDKALQVWCHWTNLDFKSICEEHFCRIERMVFWVDFKTSWVSRQRATHQLTEGLFPVHLSLLFSSKKALPSRSALERVFSGSWKVTVAQPRLEVRQPRSSHQETLVLLTLPSVTYSHFLGPRILKWE